MRLLRDGLAKFYAAIWLNLLVLITFVDFSDAINCYSGSQLQIIECSSLSCIKQTLGLDTVRYCDGQGVSSICQTYRILDTCQNIPNLGYICCCSSNLCNSAVKSSTLAGSLLLATAVLGLLVSNMLRLL